SFCIRVFNLGTPGRGEASTGLAADWILPESQRGPAPSKVKKEQAGASVDSNDKLASQVITALGGGSNIESVEGCITRLRLFISDPAKIDEPALKGLGASGVLKAGKVVQVIMGMQSDDIADRMKRLIKEGPGETAETDQTVSE
ncbi:MAG TPA: glucose PTS transporter subunit EIIB, partial [Ktedonobacteraceae bacterium]|nr:glucose PTS transporter subunit EIIB [Ktedonobacteraceae bacterium]